MDINQTILDYLKASDTDYAIMINGDWGCGKTYFLNHDFDVLVKDVKCPEDPDNVGKIKQAAKDVLSEKSESSYNYVPAYISLYGLSSPEDFKYRVFLGVNSWAKNSVVGFVGSLATKVAGVFGADLDKEDVSKLSAISNNNVLVFDDLERICLDKITVKEVLGLINSYVEHDKRKVVIVCNEKVFNGEEKGKERDEEYWTFKEKTVRYTCSYQADIPSVYDALIESIKDDAYRDFLTGAKLYILQMFARGGKKNLRTLKFFIDSMGQVYNSIPQLKYRDAIARRIVITYLLYSIEYKNGRCAEDLKELKEKYEIDLDANIFLDRVGLQSQDSPKEPSYADILSERYGGFYNDEMLHFPHLVDYIITGSLDSKKVEQVSVELDGEYQKCEVKEEFQVYRDLNSFSTISDDDVAGKIDSMLRFVDEGRYSPYYLLNVYALLVKYHCYKIAEFCLTDEIDKKFIAALDAHSATWAYNDMFFYKTPVWDDRERGNESYEKYMAIKNHAIDLNNKSRLLEKDNAFNKFLEEAESDNVSAIRHYRESYDNRISLSGVDWSRITAVLQNGSNAMACELAQCLQFIVSDTSCIKPDDMSSFKDVFVKWLDDYMAHEDHRIRRMYIAELYKHIKSNFR